MIGFLSCYVGRIFCFLDENLHLYAPYQTLLRDSAISIFRARRGENHDAYPEIRRVIITQSQPKEWNGTRKEVW